MNQVFTYSGYMYSLRSIYAYGVCMNEGNEWLKDRVRNRNSNHYMHTFKDKCSSEYYQYVCDAS